MAFAPRRNKLVFDGNLPPTGVTVTSDTIASVPYDGKLLTVESQFTYGSSGTTAKLYVQTSLDDGDSWFDIACHAFTTATAKKISAVCRAVAPASQAFAPTDGTLADDTVVNGVLGDRIRVKLVVVGTYASTSLRVDVVFN